MAMDEDRAYLVAEVWFEHIDPPVTFAPEDASGLSGRADVTLARYYDLAKRGRLGEVEALFATEDGSRERFALQLAQNPDMYSNLSALETISIGYRALFGAYELAGVTLSGGGLTVDWRDDLLCLADACFMSNVMDLSTGAERVAEVLVATAAEYAKSGIDLSPFAAALAAAVAQGRVLEILPELEPAGVELRPMDVYANLVTLGEVNRFELGPDVQPDVPAEIQVIVEMLEATQASDAEGLAVALGPFWTSFPGDGVFRMTETPRSDDSPPAVDPQGLVSKSFVWEAFQEKVKGWTAFDVLGIARTLDVVFIFVEPLLPDGPADTIQLFSVVFVEEAGGYQVVEDGDQILPWYALREPLVLQFIAEQYGGGNEAP